MNTKTAEHIVETWFDKNSKNWITQIKDFDGNQIGSAYFAGNKSSAKVNHSDALAVVTLSEKTA